MIRLVPDIPYTEFERPLPRLWLVFFLESPGAAWWGKIFRRGFRHVSAACWYDDQQRWVYYNPTRKGTVIELYGYREFDVRLGELMATSGAIVRFASRHDRGCTPATWHCVGAIKALLGISGCALSPWQLFCHLRSLGAETVEIPARDPDIQQSATAAAS